MRGERAVAFLPRQRRVRQVADRAIEDRIVDRLRRQRPSAHARDLQRADRLAHTHVSGVGRAFGSAARAAWSRAHPRSGDEPRGRHEVESDPAQGDRATRRISTKPSLVSPWRSPYVDVPARYPVRLRTTSGRPGGAVTTTRTVRKAPSRAVFVERDSRSCRCDECRERSCQHVCDAVGIWVERLAAARQ